MHIHILGICGTFMGGIALIARQAGHRVTGSDRNVYPPMSDQLRAAGIELIQGYDAAQLDLNPDLIVVGNVMRRGMGVVERMLNEGRAFVSGPQWLHDHYLNRKTVLAAAGTHGKTTTSSMLAWILEYAGRDPGFLIGGIPGNFTVSARDTGSGFFVIEADEYDCAFFDKRSKFVHYKPSALIMNNLEYDHADIFESVRDIQKQFHHLVRTVPANGLIVMPGGDAALEEVIAMGCWTPVVRVGAEAGLHAELLRPDGGAFKVFEGEKYIAELNFACTGVYNTHNALMALAAARYAGVAPEISVKALAEFKLPKRRMELRGEADGVAVYDDFAHHPTAIRLTLEGLRAHLGTGRIIAVFEPRSNSMRLGANHAQLADAFAAADETFVYAGAGLQWNVDELAHAGARPLTVIHDFDRLLRAVAAAAAPGSAVLVMSNGGFNGIHRKLLDLLGRRV